MTVPISQHRDNENEVATKDENHNVYKTRIVDLTML